MSRPCCQMFCTRHSQKKKTKRKQARIYIYHSQHKGNCLVVSYTNAHLDELDRVAISRSNITKDLYMSFGQQGGHSNRFLIRKCMGITLRQKTAGSHKEVSFLTR